MARAASRSGTRRGRTTSTPVAASTVTLTRRARSERLMRYGISAATSRRLRGDAVEHAEEDRHLQ